MVPIERSDDEHPDIHHSRLFVIVAIPLDRMPRQVLTALLRLFVARLAVAPRADWTPIGVATCCFPLVARGQTATPNNSPVNTVEQTPRAPSPKQDLSRPRPDYELTCELFLAALESDPSATTSIFDGSG